MLRLRAHLMGALRRFFDERGYWEVDTPIMSRDVAVDAHLEPFTTGWSPAGTTGDSQHQATLYLQTSPEFAMKRLLASGANAIYQLGHVMRNGERGTRHNPEFTMLEWYRTGDNHLDQMAFTEELVVFAIQTVRAWLADTDELPTTLETGAEQERLMPPLDVPSEMLFAQPFARSTYDDAFLVHAGQHVLSLSVAQLRELAETHAISITSGFESADRDSWLNLLLAELVEPELGRDRAEFLYDYPASQAALAKVREGKRAVSERFELYVGGVELCNGYHELTDAHELRRRNIANNQSRKEQGLSELPLDSRLIQAMEAGLPACSGVALGFDRLLMVATGAESIDAVIPFPVDRA